MDALDRLLQLVILEKIKVWRSDGDDWKRPTRGWLKNRIFHKPEDEPWGLAIDRQELEAATAAHWPSDFSPERLPEATSSSSRAGRSEADPPAAEAMKKMTSPYSRKFNVS